MSPWLFNIYKNGVAREVNAIMLSRSFSFKNADDREKINELLFEDDMALVADS